MAEPKRKRSKGKIKRRHSTHKITAVSTVVCKKCGAQKLPHAKCPKCGNYK